jgi:hypothetical protein
VSEKFGLAALRRDGLFSAMPEALRGIALMCAGWRCSRR